VRSVAVASERGVSLVEVLVAVAIMAIVLSAFLAALSTGTLSVGVVRERVTAENLARAQLECIKGHPYVTGAISTSYTTLCPVTAPSAYDIEVDISYWDSLTNGFTSVGPDDGMQWITVTILCNGELAFTMEEYKVNR
jgi:prepilin-type N-terminal cleavage/methylation domain-containing protein